MSDQEIEEMNNLEDWEEITQDARVNPSRQRRAVVSVAFSRPDFTHVVEYAEHHGLKTSELIRKAVLAYIGADSSGAAGANLTSISGSSEFINNYLTTSSGVSSARSEIREPSAPGYSTR